ncbi:hypothetical protein TYRP_020455 [Tyrophagus putrescentiae]|nr:hypothetical protein TYRP_020455 [Tyrophagus putrescentiae]
MGHFCKCHRAWRALDPRRTTFTIFIKKKKDRKKAAGQYGSGLGNYSLPAWLAPMTTRVVFKSSFVFCSSFRRVTSVELP